MGPYTWHGKFPWNNSYLATILQTYTVLFCPTRHLQLFYWTSPIARQLLAVRLLTLLEWITYTISTSSNKQFSMKGIYSQRRALLSFVGKVHCSQSWGIFSFRHRYWRPNFLKLYFLFYFVSEYNTNRYTNRMKLGLQQIFKKKWN